MSARCEAALLREALLNRCNKVQGMIGEEALCGTLPGEGGTSEREGMRKNFLVLFSVSCLIVGFCFLFNFCLSQAPALALLKIGVGSKV